jgi:hypothetical protein
MAAPLVAVLFDGWAFGLMISGGFPHVKSRSLCFIHYYGSRFPVFVVSKTTPRPLLRFEYESMLYRILMHIPKFPRTLVLCEHNKIVEATLPGMASSSAEFHRSPCRESRLRTFRKRRRANPCDEWGSQLSCYIEEVKTSSTGGPADPPEDINAGALSVDQWTAPRRFHQRGEWTRACAFKFSCPLPHLELRRMCSLRCRR